MGCGGGAFLHDALESGCRAAAIDHSSDMLRVAREVNAEAITQGRVELVEGDAYALPFESGIFTAAVMTGVFFFFTDPAAALSEIVRVLAPGGRLAVFVSSKELRGTPAAPEPIARNLHFYEDAELQDMALAAGFSDSRVTRPNLAPYAKRVGAPPEFFDGTGGQLLIARKS